MRHASKNYQSYKLITEKENVSDVSHISQSEQIASGYNVENNKESETLGESDAIECDLDEEIEILTPETEESDESDEDTEDSIDEGRGLLRYFFFTKLFV